MNINTIQIKDINRIIAHTIYPKTSSTDAYAYNSKDVLAFSDSEKSILISRLEDSLTNSKKTFQLTFDDKSPDSLYFTLHNNFPISEKSFISFTQGLAEDLANAHFRTNIPGGYCLIGDGITKNNENFFFVIKAELQEVFNISGNKLKLIKNVFLSPAKDFFKIGMFIKQGKNYLPFMYDDQFSMQKKDLTEYFYGQFMGLTTDRNDKLKSKNYFTDTKDFIEDNISNAKDRLGLLKALTVLYREDATGIVSPRDFSEKYFEGKLKAEYDKIIDTKYPLSFTKDTSLIENRLELQRLSIPLGYSMSLVGNSNDLNEVEIIDSPTQESFESCIHEINNGDVKKLVIIRN